MGAGLMGSLSWVLLLVTTSPHLLAALVVFNNGARAKGGSPTGQHHTHIYIPHPKERKNRMFNTSYLYSSHTANDVYCIVYICICVCLCTCARVGPSIYYMYANFHILHTRPIFA